MARQARVAQPFLELPNPGPHGPQRPPLAALSWGALTALPSPGDKRQALATPYAAPDAALLPSVA